MSDRTFPAGHCPVCGESLVVEVCLNCKSIDEVGA